MHVNLSPVELASGAIDVIADQLAITGLDPGLVCIEVTEHAFRGNLLSASSIVRLGRLGVEVALDDFGMGASSLSHLRQRPLHKLKLDRSFVKSIDAVGGVAALDAVILSGAIGIAKDLDLQLVAEGVETVAQLDWLRDAGCEYFQGWAFGAAVPVGQFDLPAVLPVVPVDAVMPDPADV